MTSGTRVRDLFKSYDKAAHPMRFVPNSPVPRISQDLDMVMVEDLQVLTPTKNIRKEMNFESDLAIDKSQTLDQFEAFVQSNEQ